ncbi:MAG: TonB-dependent receptor [Synoicihabitans sp.]
MNRLKKTKLPLAALFACVVPFASAQVEEEKAIEMEEFKVSDVPIEENIVPSSRPFNSVYGTDRSIVDTPRSVTIISREQLDAISIKTPRDFARLTSSSYTKSNFGAPTSPNLRGQEADMFTNGSRKGLTSNGNGLPINFNAVESVNIVKGPAGPVYGTSNYLGGYADLITKRAFFDKPRGEVSLTMGSYDVFYGTWDYGGPLSDTLAYRVSISGEKSKGFYYRGKKETQAIYGTVTWRPNDNYELFVAGEFFNASYTENWGMNRPTQDLIDNLLYIPNAQTDAEYLDYIARLGDGTSVFSGTAGVDAASRFGGAGFATFVPLDLANPVRINPRQRLLAPGDDSNGRNVWGQAISTWKSSDELKWVYNTYFQWIDRNTFSSYHYSELLRDNWSWDNSLSAIYKKDNFGANVGLRYRYEDVWSVNHFFNEPVNFWDLTRDPNSWRVPDQGFAGNPIVPGQPARGILNNWYYGGTGGHSTGYIAGPFAQIDYNFGDQVIIDVGFGQDYVDATEDDPIGGAAVSSTSDTASLDNYSAAIVYKVTDTVSLYANYGYSEAHPADTGGRFDVGSFGSPLESELFEVGAKAAMLDNTLFASAAVFDREFVSINPDNTRDPVFVEGFEIEFNYQPNKQLWATFGYSYIKSERNAGFFATAYTADRADETGGLYVTPTFAGPVDSDTLFDFPGNPQHQAVGLLSYKFTDNWGARANFVYTGSFFLGYNGMNLDPGNQLFNHLAPGQTQFTVNSVQIPDQYEIDLTLFYEADEWEVKVTAFNVTDEINWDAPNAGYGNGSVVLREPVRYEATFTYKF